MRDITFYTPPIEVEPVVNNYITKTTPIPRYFLVWNILVTLLLILDLIHAV